jgi:tetratricopeptide (TPR) repeat protein
LTRPFDKHLDSDELDRLVSSHAANVTDSGRPAEQVLEEAQRHVESCQDCSRKLQMHNSVQSEILNMGVPKNTPLGSDCVGDSEWLNVAAGLLPEAKTRELMRHAAQCGHCGPLLKNAAETLADEVTLSEETLLVLLGSARPEWKRNMASTLSSKGQARQLKPSWWRGMFAWPNPAYAFGGIAVVVLVAWIGLRTLRPPSADQLLTQAYTERRTLEVRIPGARYAPMRVERSAGGSNLDKPPSLLKAEALIGENLSKNPNDPVWLQARARAELLDGNYDSAIKSLQQALETQPDSPQLLTDLGSAYFLRAEMADHQADYGEAVELLERVLHKDTRNEVALFNEAIILERLSLFQGAIEDWTRYLAIDGASPWADEARASLLRIKKKMADRESRIAAPLLSPTSFSATNVSMQSEAIAALDNHAERYLDLAVRSWLPDTYGDQGRDLRLASHARPALELLARILKDRHDDSWLADFLQNAPSGIQGQALRDLLASDDALQKGRYSLSIRLAQQSMHRFELSGSRAGMLRASFALMMSQTFALRYRDCLRTSAIAIPLLSHVGYRWLLAQTLIQQGQCQEGAAQLEEALQSNSKGAELAARFHYPGLGLRATAFEASYLVNTDNNDGGLRALTQGISTFWASDITNTRGENLYTALSNLAEARNWPNTQALVMAEILMDFPTQNPVEQVVEHELLASAQARAGDFQTAQATLRQNNLRRATLPADAVTLRQAEIALEDAEIHLHLGDAHSAASDLAGLRQQFEYLRPSLFQAEYFTAYGEALLSLGQDATARPMFHRALGVTEMGLKDLTQEANKLAWSRAQGQIYRDILETELKSGNPFRALAWWEWYKGASLRHASTTGTQAIRNDDPSSFDPPSVLSAYALGPDTALISYVFHGDFATTFVVHGGNIQSHSLRLPPDLEISAIRFLSSCASPSGDIGPFSAASRHLYTVLIAPLEDDLRGVTALQIETDGILDRIPFDLLSGPDGHYLSDRFKVSYSPGLAYKSDVGDEAISDKSSALIVTVGEAGGQALSALPDAQEEGVEVASRFRYAKLVSGNQVTRANLLRDLQSVQIFHFAGHTVADVNRVGLVLGPNSLVFARDFARLRLQNLKLAVLSACGTANGTEGTPADVNSIARTLEAAGVPHVIASRWRVDSTVTRQLIRAFYASLTSGKTPADSLHAAIVATRSLPGYQHPYYWGSFAVFGRS